MSTRTLSRCGAAAARRDLVVFASRFGWVAYATAREDGDPPCLALVTALTFGHRSRESAVRALGKKLEREQRHSPLGLAGAVTARVSSGERDLLRARLEAYSDGAHVDFEDVDIDDRDLTPFSRRTLTACRRIAWGATRTYGELAAACGSPGAARAVGQVMAHNRFPLIVPCHRVLAASGRLGGFSAPEGTRMKRRLLALESG